MNKDRRRVLYSAVETIKELKDLNDTKAAAEKVEYAMELVEDAKDDEQYSFDNLPESLQWSARGEDMENNVADLEDALDDLEIVKDTIDEMEEYDYEQLRKDILSALNSISNATER